VQLKTNGTPSVKASVTALWGTKALDNVVDLDLSFDVHTEKSVLRRLEQERCFLFPFLMISGIKYSLSPAPTPLQSKSVV
jgi:hypothetical protein